MKIVKTLLVLLCSLFVFTNVYAQDDAYYVKDTKSGFVNDFLSLYEANNFYQNHLDEYDNLLLLKNDEIIDMEYGYIEFVNELVEYHSVSKNEDDYIASVYGIDAAYLSNVDGNIYFAVSGDIGYTSSENVLLHEFDNNVSVYHTNNEYLFHNIRNQLEYGHYAYSNCLDYIPKFMASNATYYSYDGHYFYDNYYEMIDDYRNGEHINSINENAYYNYYQYLPYRSLSNYINSDLENYVYNTLGIDGRLTHYEDLNGDNANDEVNKSQLYGNVAEFINNQNIYGTNAMMLLSSAIVESSYGKNLDSYLKNNLYLNAAYDSEYENANDRYNSIADSIRCHSKYFIGGIYSNSYRNDYHGTHLGNKLSGINVEYTLDQYYGEKVASKYFEIDKKNDLKDYNSLAIGIITNALDLNMYKDESLSEKLFTIDNINDFSFVILDENENAYKIQIDYSFDNQRKYDFDKCVAYINKEDVDNVLNESKIHDYKLNTVNYDFNGGTYNGYDKLSIQLIDNEDLNNIVPKLDGHKFVGYDIDNSSTYIAKYIKINDVKINYLFEKQGELLPYPDLSKARLRITYEDGSNEVVKVNTDFILPYKITDETQDIYAVFNGVNATKQIQMDVEYFDIYNSFEQAIINKDYSYIRGNIRNIKYPFKMQDIRNIDYDLKQKNNRNYVINDKTEKYDISLSGLDLSLDDRYNFHLIEDTYYVIVNDIKKYSEESIAKLASGYDFDVVTGINISFKFNYQNIYLAGPCIVQLDINNKKNENIYTVYHLESDGDIVKCKTTWSNNYIQFVINEGGDYLVLSKPSENYTDILDDVEDLSYANMGFDNNRINLEFMLGLALILFSLIGILVYYSVMHAKENEWKDYKKSLQRVDIVQEEKQKN